MNHAQVPRDNTARITVTQTVEQRVTRVRPLFRWLSGAILAVVLVNLAGVVHTQLFVEKICHDTAFWLLCAAILAGPGTIFLGLVLRGHPLWRRDRTTTVTTCSAPRTGGHSL